MFRFKFFNTQPCFFVVFADLTYDEAVDISLEELEIMEAVDEPLWDELHRGWEEYIKIHGERVYDDEDDE